MNTAKKTLIVISSALLAVYATQSEAAVIVSDSFSSNGATQDSTIAGRTPNLANQPGTTWENVTGGSAYYEVNTGSLGNPVPSAATPAQSGVGVNISSNGGYVKPSLLTLEADLLVNQTTGSASSGRGVQLGYFQQINANAYSNNGFTGFIFDSLGALSFIADYNTTKSFPPTVVSSSVAFGGSFDQFSFYHLAFSIDTTSGNVTSLTLSGSTADYSSLVAAATGYFTDSHTTYMGFGASSENSATFGYVDNVQLSTVPEPSTYFLCLVSAGIVVLQVRRRRAQS
jgi:hypothetical protein